MSQFDEKPREFWIKARGIQENVPIDISEPAENRWVVTLVQQVSPHPGNSAAVKMGPWLHVIEKSAYDKQAAKIAELEKEVERHIARAREWHMAALHWYTQATGDAAPMDFRAITITYSEAEMNAALDAHLLDKRKIAELEKLQSMEAEAHHKTASLYRQARLENEQLAEKLRVATEALEWFANENLYNMTSFVTASPIFDVENPQNVRVEGNPILKLGLETACQALEKLRGEG